MVQRKPPEGAIDKAAPGEGDGIEEPKIEFQAAGDVESPKPILSEDDILLIRAKAKKKVEDEIKKKAAADMLSKFEREERIAAGLEEEEPDDPMVMCKIDLAPYCDRIMIDFKIFLHGHTYEVPLRVAKVIMETCFNSWKHQQEVKGERLDETVYRKFGATISPSVAKIGDRLVSLH